MLYESLLSCRSCHSSESLLPRSHTVSSRNVSLRMPIAKALRLRLPPVAFLLVLSRSANPSVISFRPSFQARAMINAASLDDDATANEATPSANSIVGGAHSAPLVMQIIIRRDLMDVENWGVGPLIAQGAHAATAVLYESRALPETQLYLADLHNMRKVVLQTPDADTLTKLSALLSKANPPIAHHLWLEQPENVPTCIALAPNRRDGPIKKALDKAKCRLWQG